MLFRVSSRFGAYRFHLTFKISLAHANGVLYDHRTSILHSAVVFDLSALAGRVWMRSGNMDM